MRIGNALSLNVVSNLLCDPLQTYSFLWIYISKTSNTVNFGLSKKGNTQTF